VARMRVSFGSLIVPAMPRRIRRSACFKSGARQLCLIGCVTLALLLRFTLEAGWRSYRPHGFLGLFLKRGHDLSLLQLLDENLSAPIRARLARRTSAKPTFSANQSYRPTVRMKPGRRLGPEPPPGTSQAITSSSRKADIKHEKDQSWLWRFLLFLRLARRACTPVLLFVIGFFFFWGVLFRPGVFT